MFDWMVNNLTALAPSDFYLCVPNQLSMYGARMQQPISGSFDFLDFAAAKKGCNDAGGKVVFNHHNVKEAMDDWSGSGTEEAGKVFGMSMVEYCVYTPGLTLTHFVQRQARQSVWNVDGGVLCLHAGPDAEQNVSRRVP